MDPMLRGQILGLRVLIGRLFAYVAMLHPDPTGFIQDEYDEMARGRFEGLPGEDPADTQATQASMGELLNEVMRYAEAAVQDLKGRA